MTTATQVVEGEEAAIDRAQLHLALASVSYMSGQTARSRAEAEAVLAEPGLPAPMYAAAENRRVLALLANGNELGFDSPADWCGETTRGLRATLVARSALAWRDGRVTDTLELLWAASCASAGSDVGDYPAFGLAMVFAALGRVDDSRACVLAAADEIALRSEALWAAAPAVFSSRVDLVAGRLDAARESAQAGLELATRLGTPMVSAIARDVLVAEAVLRGDLGVAADRVEAWRADDLAARLPFGTAHRQWAALRLRDAQGADVLGDGAAEAAFDLLACDRCLLLEEPSAAAWLIRVARRAGDERRVQRVLLTAERLAEINGRYPSVVAAADHAGGVAVGDLRRLERAATMHGSPWARASASEDAAGLLGAQGDRSAARSWLERAATEYGRCQAKRDTARIRSRLRDLGVRSRHWSRQERPVCGWGSLTETEQSVAALVAEGLSNQQVATRMFLSRHTVDFHLRHIFRKLGVASRVALTRIALCDEPPSAPVRP
jgi:DNA-binding CsgD family transcriptional regulator